MRLLLRLLLRPVLLLLLLLSLWLLLRLVLRLLLWLLLWLLLRLLGTSETRMCRLVDIVSWEFKRFWFGQRCKRYTTRMFDILFYGFDSSWAQQNCRRWRRTFIESGHLPIWNVLPESQIFCTFFRSWKIRNIILPRLIWRYGGNWNCREYVRNATSRERVLSRL